MKMLELRVIAGPSAIDNGYVSSFEYAIPRYLSGWSEADRDSKIEGRIVSLSNSLFVGGVRANSELNVSLTSLGDSMSGSFSSIDALTMLAQVYSFEMGFEELFSKTGLSVQKYFNPVIKAQLCDFARFMTGLQAVVFGVEERSFKVEKRMSPRLVATVLDSKYPFSRTLRFQKPDPLFRSVLERRGYIEGRIAWSRETVAPALVSCDSNLSQAL
ncbi:MAG: hypothetical protein Q7K43_04125 [Candidatus Woesearchaeota archaeon]|nr:hypothetical protein [Candidatus Woesearchaeota archaeon]